MKALEMINFTVSILFTVFYAYQLFYIPVSWLKKRKKPAEEPALHDFAVLICARNEEAVIGDLIASLKNQTYPTEKLSVFVMADNCTDQTAEVARSAGAAVYSRTDSERVGKGYALDALLKRIRADHPAGFDGYFVFDADNILSRNYVEEMNRTFSQGHAIVTGYRNSKNYGSNWISAGYALWFLRESRYLNESRFLLNTGCAVSGTGFLFSRQIAEGLGGWPYHLLTEDIEFTAHQTVLGHKIAYCASAVLYDEQPTDFRQSWRQRLRWSRGFLQVFGRYGGRLIGGALRGSFSCLDLLLTLAPAFILTLFSVACNLGFGLWGLFGGADVTVALRSMGELLLHMYGFLLMIGGVTLATEWNRIYASTRKKVLSLFTFPLFMATYIPISLAALFCKPQWKPIHHTLSAKNLQEEISEILEN